MAAINGTGSTLALPADTLKGASAVQFVNLVSMETIQQILWHSKEHGRKIPPLEVWAKFAGFPETDWVASWEDSMWKILKVEHERVMLLSGMSLRTEIVAADSEAASAAKLWHSNLREMAARKPELYADCWDFAESGKLASVYETDANTSPIRCSSRDMYWKLALKPLGSAAANRHAAAHLK